MPAKIRLTRRGRKGRPFYHIVVADSRAPRDGRFIEKLGIYNPMTNPATIELEFDKALRWLQNGAQPTDTCRAILSYKGVLCKKHLLEGVKKGAFDEAEAERKFQVWLKEKEAKIQSKVEGLTKEAEDNKTKRLSIEAQISQKRAEEIAKRNSELAEASKKEAEETAEGTPEGESAQAADDNTEAEA